MNMTNMDMTAAAVLDTAKARRDHSHFGRCAAGLLLTLCATLAVAADDAAAHKQAASAMPAASIATAAALPGAANAASPEAAAKPVAAGNARAANAEKPAPTPRRPDTAGWRRIMAGAGRT
jgi:hypothetical protein